jgi:hypothetical protein
VTRVCLWRSRHGWVIFSDFLEKKILDTYFNGSTYAKPATLYAGAFTVAPSDTGGGTECPAATNGYARVAANSWGAASGTTPTTTTNSADITFPQDTTADWGTIVAIGIFDQLASGGNLLAWATLGTSKLIQVGDILTIPTGSASIQLD